MFDIRYLAENETAYALQVTIVAHWQHVFGKAQLLASGGFKGGVGGTAYWFRFFLFLHKRHLICCVHLQ